MQLSETQQKVLLRGLEISMELHKLREAGDSITVGATHYNLLLTTMLHFFLPFCIFML